MILILISIFVLLSILVGGNRTAKSLVTLFLNAIIMSAMICLISIDFSPVIVSMIATILIVCITVFYQNEVNEKTFIAFISVMIIVVLLLSLVLIFIYGGHLQGLSTVGQNKIRESNGYNGDIEVNMFIIEVFVILLTLVGAVIDTAVAVTSGVYEVARHGQDHTSKDLFCSGMKIGASILSSTVNTLFFIFAGEYLIMFIDFAVYYSFGVMINSREFSQGIINIIISAVGCIAVIPISSCLAAYKFSSRRD